MVTLAPAFTVTFEVLDPWCATLSLRCHCAHSDHIRIIHDTSPIVRDYDLDGDECLSALQVTPGEALMIMVTDGSERVIGGGLYGVQIGNKAPYTQVLVELSPSSVEIRQSNEETEEAVS
ncbi:MAG TPA: hypothetical protein VKR06_46140 [Ktedonosporobacter sp.]|nr:hypothetical protein [Ktedonosporobacter sp.]